MIRAPLPNLSRYRRVERREWLTKALVWVDWPAPKKEGRIKLDRRGNETRLGIGWRYPVQNSGVKTQLRVMERFREFLTAAHQ